MESHHFPAAEKHTHVLSSPARFGTQAGRFVPEPTLFLPRAPERAGGPFSRSSVETAALCSPLLIQAALRLADIQHDLGAGTILARRRLYVLDGGADGGDLHPLAAVQVLDLQVYAHHAV